MSYATKDDVKAMFRDFADNTEAAVDDTDLDLFIANNTAMIDSKIGTLYEMPITELQNPESFKVLKQLQMFKVACIVDDILNDYAEADKKPTWCKKAEMLMKALVPEKDKKTCRQCEPTMKLPDAVYIGTPTQKNKMSVKATTGRIFEKGADNW